MRAQEQAIDELVTEPLDLPLVGREIELELIRDLRSSAAKGQGGTLVLTGGSGLGKSRLLRMTVEEAQRAGWWTLFGRAYPVESGVPYASISDAFIPLFRKHGLDALTKLSRGTAAELSRLFPIASISDPLDLATGLDSKTRSLWSFRQFISALAERAPVLLALDDVQWADVSSLELLHFLGRQIGSDRVLILCGYNDEVPDGRPQLEVVVESLLEMGMARSHSVVPLTRAQTEALIHEAFGVDAGTAREFGQALFGWTRGNPYFIAETLKSLIERGRIRQREGVWVGWELVEIDPPRTIRDAVRGRFRTLESRLREVAELLAAVGTSVGHEVLLVLSGMGEGELVRRVEELRLRGLIEERLEGDEVVYDFTHPMIRESLYAELGLARTRLLHTRIAEVLEAHYGERATEYSDELAYHYARSSSREGTGKAVRYLAAAGREALRKYADREAADYLTAALDRASSAGQMAEQPQLMEDLARARQRLGDFDGAVDLWHRRLEIAESGGDGVALARIHHRLGLVDYWRHRYPAALDRLEAGLEAAREVADPKMQARLHLARGDCWMELGRALEAREEIESALRLAESIGDDRLLGSVHLALLLLHTWTGPPEQARQHRDRVFELARDAADTKIRWSAHWGAAVLSGLTGDSPALAQHLEAAQRLADEMRSPLHRLRIAEVSIEFLANTGEWDGALALGERAATTARDLNQRSVLARILVWTSLIYFGRGEVERGIAAVEEAWEISGARRDDAEPDVHTVVPAHVGRMAMYLAANDYDRAIATGEAGLAIADRTGYTVWAIHRLLPILAEAHLLAGDLDGAARVGARLRSDSERLGHALGLAWADACDACLVWLRGDAARGAEVLTAAAKRLEAIPVVPDAARLRRHLAARLRDTGDRDGALRELRHIHEIFVRLRAEPELAKTREQIRELGARPPVRASGHGLDGLSERELEIAELVAQGMSNKAIARSLGISPRTVSTHLTNIFGKLGVDSRAELAQVVGGTSILR